MPRRAGGHSSSRQARRAECSWHAPRLVRGRARSPSFSLGLVVALNVMSASLEFRSGAYDKGLVGEITSSAIKFQTNAAPNVDASSLGPDVTHPAVKRARALGWLGLAWNRLGRGASEPVVRARPWGTALAVVVLAGTAAGLLRLTIGFWAVAVCCRRGRPVEDPEMIILLEEMQCKMRCGRAVALRAVPDLTTPATAGRRRPVVLLPDDWRSWTDAERRAVLAHELAHIVRGDYATGLLARLAVVLNCFHPLVRWMAGRQQLQQEQAADAMAALFAGGRARYLVALSSLALRQDGRSPCWPARAFLPARGALIRRIAMLRDEFNREPSDPPLPPVRRMLTVLGLVGLTMGLATLRGPVRGADGPSPAVKAVVTPSPSHEPWTAFVAPYVRDDMDGVAVIRPAAAFRHKGLDPLLAVIQSSLGEDFSVFAKKLKVDTSRQGFTMLRCQDIEWLTAGIGFGVDRTPPQNAPPPPTDGAVVPMHRISFGSMAARMVEPFDWPAFLNQWRFGCQEAHEKGHKYYRITAEFKRFLGRNPCFFLPDDRTIVFDEEDVIRRIACGEGPPAPAYFRGKEWERASRGLLAIAINNENGTFGKHYDLGRPDDAVVLSLFNGLDAWIIGVDDADAIVLHAEAACRSRDASEEISRSLNSLINRGRQFLEHGIPDVPDSRARDQVVRMLTALAANVRVEHTDTAIEVQARNFGSLADFAVLVATEERESKARVAARNGASQSVKQ